jgi:hypothetical protein
MRILIENKYPNPAYKDVVRAKLTKLDKLKNTYSSLVEFVIDTSIDTL